MNKILIANRGEIAVRIIRSARRMGILTVAVFSEADRLSPHVQMADEAVCIGPAPSRDSYLRGEKIIEAALQTEAQGIHPGYGFLSENADFARAVKEAGLIFIGPSPESIEIMGNKLAAKEAVIPHEIPLVPGTKEAVTDGQEAKKIARQIGFPVLIKAAAGGGGKGMRIVRQESEFDTQMERAVSEARSAFDDGAVFLEKYITSPRHIEIQVLTDEHGNGVHLFERECSIQRRHQKVVEEAPSAVLTPELRREMGATALRVAKACNYTGAGTVEFLVDEQLNFYFLEMNTRLQVEHPVTELITGIDLVEQQIRVARGEALAISQEDLSITGHAIELRVYAEDPFNDFLPSTGVLNIYQQPKGDGIRIDDGYEQGMEIPIYYDPLIAKLIAYGPNRLAAIERMKTAINAYNIEGVSTTLAFGRFVMEHPAFIKGDFDTHFVQQYFLPEKILEKENMLGQLAAITALKRWLDDRQKLRVPQNTSNGWNNNTR